MVRQLQTMARSQQHFVHKGSFWVPFRIRLSDRVLIIFDQQLEVWPLIAGKLCSWQSAGTTPQAMAKRLAWHKSVTKGEVL
jgi:hypothetical protein